MTTMKDLEKNGCECFEDDTVCLAHFLRASDVTFRPEMGYPRLPGMG